ncbi:hypothetical protein CH354_14510 [Leptospira levettii]|uniref:DUF1574 domain-containing protein n=1 Tax=Leptospira levettii TaxID=2023178 RepID=UPI000C2A398E|nr:DUF1574 domain-containing protein [Leptospira levettii]PJZ36300.1 hypothetical protein CH354_14510 [Leptospira levettii]PJZ90033.1 hypothetical protein CH368_03830 [Leptospira levettii]PJZ99062.1 hypothetical protein CH369_16765 [Leptospira levettii]
MLKARFLFYPVYLLIFLFLVDSIFRIPYIQTLAKIDLTAVNYKAKSDFLEKLLKEKPGVNSPKTKKIMLILGSSRLLYFDYDELVSFYPDWEIYNLSSAVTTPAYYDFQLTKILDAGIKPDLVIMETDPNQFNQNSVFKSSNLTYSFDLGYVLSNLSLFGKDHVSFYLGRKLFAVGTYKPYIDQMWKNYKNPYLDNVLGMHQSTYDYIISHNGNGLSPIDNYMEKDSNALLLTSHRTLDWLFASYQRSNMQFGFYEKILNRLQEEKIKAVIVWPLSSPDFESLMEKESLVKTWETEIDSITKEHNFSILKLKDDPSYNCNAFADGGHVAKDCYRSLMRSILLDYFRRYEPNRL